ncbi:hypothetical protein E4U11_003442 [Claviceps purpurea]|nr:hypothetical protein E4U11_003442 [Claviceps purpurea]
MNSRLQDMNSRIAELSSDVNSGFEEMAQKNDKTSIKMEALNKNTMSRFDNRLPGAPPGARCFGTPVQHVAMAECLHELGLAVPKNKDERLRQVKKAYGADIHVDVTVGVHWNRDADADERAEDECT